MTGQNVWKTSLFEHFQGFEHPHQSDKQDPADPQHCHAIRTFAFASASAFGTNF
jgi:hypothetical protein